MAKEYFKLIGVLVAVALAVAMLSECMQSLERNERNMVLIEDGYCYDADTKIIYMESDTGQHSMSVAYSPYYDEEGRL